MAFLWHTTLLFLLALLGTAGAASPQPALEIEQDLARVHREIADPQVLNRDTCTSYVTRNTAFMLERGAETYLPKDEIERAALLDAAPRITRSLFELRLALLERVRTFHAGGPDLACLNAARRALRYSRFVEEMLGEWVLAERGDEVPLRVLAGDEPALMLNGPGDAYEPRSGDILMVRSRYFVSATIARIGDEEGQFSHAALVHVDDDGKVWVLESLIERGAIAVPWDEWQGRRPVRAVVMRHRDSKVAAGAARWLHDWIAERARTGKGPAPYDFTMDFTDNGELFCVELVQFAFRESTNGAVQVPRFASSIGHLGGRPFLEQLGVRQTEIYTPSDFEIDPNLTPAAEWRDYSQTAHTRIQDAILSSVFHWMTDMNYEFTYGGFTQVVAGFFWRLLRPLGVGKTKVPANMTRGFFDTVLELRSLTGVLEEQLAVLNRQGIESRGWSADYKTLLTALEELRREDCARRRAGVGGWGENPFLTDHGDRPATLLFHRYFDVPESAGGCPL